jgi:hypothetical protein
VTLGAMCNVLHILPVTLSKCFWRTHVSIFDGYMKKCWNCIFLSYAPSDLELSKMTLRDLVSRNICYQQHQFLLRVLGDTSSDKRTDGQKDTVIVCSPEIFSGSIIKPTLSLSKPIPIIVILGENGNMHAWAQKACIYLYITAIHSTFDLLNPN